MTATTVSGANPEKRPAHGVPAPKKEAMLPIDKEILHLAIPSIVSNITVPLLGLVDLAIAGHLGSARYIAAISVGSMIFNIIYWLMGFLRMGTSGMTGQAFGAGDAEGLRLLLRRSLTLSLCIAAAFLVLQWPLREAAMGIIHPSADVWPLATAYFDIIIWGAPAMLSLYSLNGWYIGMQDTRVPMAVAIFQNVVNIAASLLFVFAMGMKVEGIALGTLMAQWSGVALSAALLRRKLRSLQAPAGKRPADRTERYSWRVFFRTDRDIFLRTVCLVAVNLAFTSAGARQGDVMLAVNTLLLTFYSLFSYVMDGFAFAGEAMGGKYVGAGDSAGLSLVTRRLLFGWGLWLALAFTVAYVFGGQWLVGLLTNDATVRTAAGAFAWWTWLIPLAGFAAFVYDGIFIGLTATRGMLLSSATASAAFFVILGTVLLLPSRVQGSPVANHMLWLAFIVYLALRGAIQHVLIRRKGIATTP
ncbi:MATE efflux family protein [Hallella multisaccharivorax DSM 17128]|uniref:MATE efflux family protein n=1 Tax=Hallella multisaccharivorax DSM 17128 TaxID=688246 RepID=F8N9B6_9BACT|nr:MATE efflux family protein [Hallella multisaccharivorax DSM 17128]